MPAPGDSSLRELVGPPKVAANCDVEWGFRRPVPGGVLGQLEEVQLEPAAKAYNALANAHKTLAAGFTTVRNLGDRDGITLALRDAIRAGKVVGPNIVDAGTSISTTSGHMDPALGFRDDLRDALDRHDNLCDGADACRRAVRLQVARGVDVIKIATTGGVNSRIGAGLGRQMFDDEVQADQVGERGAGGMNRPGRCDPERGGRPRRQCLQARRRILPAEFAQVYAEIQPIRRLDRIDLNIQTGVINRVNRKDRFLRGRVKRDEVLIRPYQSRFRRAYPESQAGIFT